MRVGVRLIAAGLLAVGAVAAAAQVDDLEIPSPTPPQELGPPATVHGVVMNAATGHPLPHALVWVVDGSKTLGALTDDDGRFALPGVPSGMRVFGVKKPGFRDAADGPDEMTSENRMVKVAGGMHELTFTLAPLNAISAHVTLSTGVPAQGIGLGLAQQSVQHGVPMWQVTRSLQTTPDGAVRFSGLNAGTYLLFSRAEFDNNRAAQPRCNSETPAEMTGFAPEFYNGGGDLAGATRIEVSGGQNAEVNLALNLTRFHLVQARMGNAAELGADWQFKYELMDRGGRELEYPLREEKDHSVCVYLPDGLYTLAAEASRRAGAADGEKTPEMLRANVEFSVEGGPRSVQAALGQGATTAVHVRYEPGPPASPKPAGDGSEGMGEPEDPLNLTARRVNGVAATGDSAELVKSGELNYNLESMTPGSYWMSVSTGLDGVCVGGATAGGQSLGKNPWVAGSSGAGAPIEVVLRTDCATVTVRLPAELVGEGDEAGAIVVYLVPEFDAADDLSASAIEMPEERSTVLRDVTPGTYRLYAFRGPRSIAYRDAAALSKLGTGREVTVEPRGNQTVVLEGITQ